VLLEPYLARKSDNMDQVITDLVKKYVLKEGKKPKEKEPKFAKVPIGSY